MSPNSPSRTPRHDNLKPFKFLLRNRITMLRRQNVKKKRYKRNYIHSLLVECVQEPELVPPVVQLHETRSSA